MNLLRPVAVYAYILHSVGSARPIHTVLSEDTDMLRKAGLMFTGTVALVFVLGTAMADEKTPSIKEIMKAVSGTKTEKGICDKCSAAGKDAKWEDAQKLAKSLTECCVNLPKNKPPRGAAASWEKLSNQYSEQGKAIAKAAEDKDPKALTEAVTTFKGACMTCHMAHKGKK